MRIGIDCRLAGQTHAGIGRYIENLIIRLPALADDIEWVLFFSDANQAQAISSVIPKSASVEVQIVPVRHYSVAEQLQLPIVFRRAKLDLLHVPHFNVPLLYRGPFVVTIHDLLWHEYRGLGVTTLSPLKYWFKYLGYRLVASQAVKRAQVVFVPAQTIKKTLGRYYPRLSSKIVVTKEGVFRSGKPSRRWAESKTPSSPTLLYVGSLYPHKNVRLVLAGLQELPEYQLLVVGSRTVFQDQFKRQVQQAGLSDRVKFLGQLSDQDLWQQYQQVTAVVQPSFSEGFGLTGVEALAAGVPLLASQIPIFQEIYQDEAIFFDPHSVNSFISAVKKLERTNRSTLIKRGQKLVQRYSWDRMAEQTLAGYRQVVVKKSRK